MTPETAASEFDLDLADIHRALAYYYDNIEQMRELRAERYERMSKVVNPESARNCGKGGTLLLTRHLYERSGRFRPIQNILRRGPNY